jgi:hypothetical protein
MLTTICDLLIELFSLKFTAKQLARQSKKSEKDEAKEKLKVKKVRFLPSQESIHLPILIHPTEGALFHPTRFDSSC